jgi:ATP-dependent DNA helicase DinG
VVEKKSRVPDVEALLGRAVEAVGGETRAGQLAMSNAVAHAMDVGEHLLVQAGTGTGKSLAYLVPALRHAVAAQPAAVDPAASAAASRDARDDGGKPARSTGPVIVATATIALQRQLIDRDLPRLVEALGPALPRLPVFAILKGRRNYLCLERLNAGPNADQPDLFEDAPSAGPSNPSGRLGQDVVRITEWANHTDSGDRDELVPGVSERAWGQFAVSARECLGATRCPYGADCFAEQARMRAMRADVVVTNHALLAIDALGDVAVLPEHDIVVIDEGHELVDRVTGVATEELTPALIERASQRCHRLAPEQSGRLDEAAAALGDVLGLVTPGQLQPVPVALAEVLTLVRDAARAVVAAVSTPDAGAPKPKKGEESAADAELARKQARAAIEAVVDTSTRLLGDSEHDVIWASYEERRGIVLRVAPLSVAGLLREALFKQRSIILTSATLEIGGSFDGLAGSLGLPIADAQRELRWQGLDVGSPFDHPRQGILYVAKQLPPPGRDGLSPAALDELAGLIEAAGGRTLALFSAMRTASAAADALRKRLKLAIMCQGEDSTAELVRLFAAAPTSCLFGTLSLWQGVDVPGEACQLVVLDRIPFPRPDDPLMSARSRAVSEAGGNGFMSVAASHAALLLAQGAGRLLRSATDRGVVAVLDSRLATARYGSFLRSSLPPFWYTTDPLVARASLRALDAAARHEVVQPSLLGESLQEAG